MLVLGREGWKRPTDSWGCRMVLLFPSPFLEDSQPMAPHGTSVFTGSELSEEWESSGLPQVPGAQAKCFVSLSIRKAEPPSSHQLKAQTNDRDP